MGHLPWHRDNWEIITKQFAAGRNPHALLLHGSSGLGKQVFAENLSSLLLCEAPEESKHCERCKSCVIREAGTHADLRHVSPEDSGQIKVDHIRELTRWAIQSSQHGGYKIAIIHPLEKMNLQSANALLKGLEEPPPQTLYILVTDDIASILPTVRSRCQNIFFNIPEYNEALRWLKSQCEHTENLPQLLIQSEGAPLEVLKMLSSEYIRLRDDVTQNLLALLSGENNPLEKASNLQKYQPLDVLKVLENFASTAIKLSMVEDLQDIGSQRQENASVRLAVSLEAIQLFQFRDQLLKAIRDLGGNSNPNPLLLLEAVLVNLNHSQMRK